MESILMPLIVVSMLCGLAFVALNQFTSKISCILALVGSFCPFLFITGYSSGSEWAAQLGLRGTVPFFVSSLVFLSFAKKPPYALPSCVALFMATILGGLISFVIFLGLAKMP